MCVFVERKRLEGRARIHFAQHRLDPRPSGKPLTPPSAVQPSQAVNLFEVRLPLITSPAKGSGGGLVPEVVDVSQFGDVQTESRIAGAQRKIQVDTPPVPAEGHQVQTADGLPAL